MSDKIKEDRRVRKTKKALREGLTELLIEKNIQNITVKDLTDRVDIHRSTFYANFTDIYDLYNHLEETVEQEIINIVSSDYSFKPQMFFEILFKYILENKQICRLFFCKTANTSFVSQLTVLFKDLCLVCWSTEYNIKTTTEEMEYYAQFYLSGGLGIVGKWVEDNFEYSLEDLTLMLSDIDSNIGKLIHTKLT